MTDPDWLQLKRVLREYINTEMDQWERWSLVDNCGNTVYISLSYYKDGEDYIDLDKCPSP